MSESTISITRALAELKTLAIRINETTARNWVTIAVNDKIGSKSIVDFGAEIRSAYQSYTDLLARRNALKCAIVQSNAVTNVEIAGKTYTVAEAIERKNSIIFEESMLQVLRHQFQSAKASMEKHNISANATLNTLLGGAVSKDTPVTEQELAAIANPFKKANFAELCDPLRIEEKIETLSAGITEFKLHADFALSEINAVTKITV